MKEQLIYSPEHYRERLSAYAKDTVEYKSFNGFTSYKVNKNDNDAIVEDINGQYKIYVNTKPGVFFIRAGFRDVDYRTLFFAMIKIDHQVEIKIQWDKTQNVIYGIQAVLLFIFCIASGSVFFTVMASLFAIGLLLYKRRAKKNYHNFVITFLNTIAAS